MKQKALSLLDHFTQVITTFMGSWTGVLFHTLWFTLWFVLKLDIDLLTLIVSLEAIYIGIFLLMSANKEEIQRRLDLINEKEQDRAQIDLDIKLDQKADRQLIEIKRLHKELHSQVEEILTCLKCSPDHKPGKPTT